MGIHKVLRNGTQEHVNGQPRFFVKVWDPHLKKQLGRRVVGQDEALRVEADMKAEVAIPLELRAPTDEIRAALANRRHAEEPHPRGLLTVAAWSDIYLERFSIKPDGTRRPASSVAKDRSILNAYILPTLGPRSLSSIRLPELEDLVSGLVRQDGTPLAGSSKQTVVGVLKRVFKMAVRRGALAEDPTGCMTTAWGGVSVRRRQLIPLVQDVEKLASACENLSQGMGDLVRILAYTAMRFSELAGLQAEDIDWHRRVIHVRRVATYASGKRDQRDMGKTSAAIREIPIVDQVKLPLKRAVAAADQARQGKYYETGPRWVAVGKHGRPLHYSTWRRNLSRAQEQCGVHYTAHELRHVAASLAILSGMNEHALAQMMGHSRADFTRRIYGHEFERDHSEQIAAMSAAIDARLKYEREQARREAKARLRPVSNGDTQAPDGMNDLEPEQ